MTILDQALRYGQTLRHLKVRQILWRLWYAARRRLPALRVPHLLWTTPQELDSAALGDLRAFLVASAPHHPGVDAYVHELRNGRLAVLDRSFDIDAQIPWRPEGVSRLTLYTLQYMNWLRAVAEVNGANPNPEDGALVQCWMAEWIDHNPPGTPVAWEAFPTTSRLINWCLALSVFQETSRAVRRSLAEQTAHLLHRIEYDIRANHLLKNAQALIVVGSVLGPYSRVGRKALRRGRALLEHELREQILPDGGHYERSPMYHCHVLDDCLIARAALRRPSALLEETIPRMAAFLDGLLHPDDQIPLFGDAVVNAGAPPRTVLDTVRDACGTPIESRAEANYALVSSGFYVMTTRARDARLIAKIGPPGPRYQLGHAHADVLSFELTVGGRRVIVDSGVSEYEATPMRAYCRSVRAHNTVSVNGREPLECWGAFRVGRRYYPLLREWNHEQATWWLRASHNGFKPYGHERLFVLYEGRCWIVVDTVTGPGAFTAESYLHFHPDANVLGTGGRWAVTVDGGAGVSVVPFGLEAPGEVRGALEPHQGWYCPQWGRAVAAPALVFQVQASRRARFGYALLIPGAEPISDAELEQLIEEAGKSRP